MAIFKRVIPLSRKFFFLYIFLMACPDHNFVIFRSIDTKIGVHVFLIRRCAELKTWEKGNNFSLDIVLTYCLKILVRLVNDINPSIFVIFGKFWHDKYL